MLNVTRVVLGITPTPIFTPAGSSCFACGCIDTFCMLREARKGWAPGKGRVELQVHRGNVRARGYYGRLACELASTVSKSLKQKRRRGKPGEVSNGPISSSSL